MLIGYVPDDKTRVLQVRNISSIACNCHFQEDGGTEGRTQRYKEAPEKLRAALRDLRSRSPNPVLVLNLGDIINGAATQEESKKDLDLIASIFEGELVRFRRVACLVFASSKMTNHLN